LHGGPLVYLERCVWAASLQFMAAWPLTWRCACLSGAVWLGRLAPVHGCV